MNNTNPIPTPPNLSPYHTPNTPSPLAVAMRYYPMTLALLVACTGLYVVQIATGVDAVNPSEQALLQWGANFMPYTLSHEAWRLVSSLFLHIGFLHLLFNMFALYYFGQVAERMIGSWHLLVLFLLSGIGGNVLNNYLSWQGLDLIGYAPVPSAGASGGIMGIGTALLVAALCKMQVNDIRLSFVPLLWVMAINISYGFFTTGIDNAGHIGGAITGLVLGFGYFWRYKLRQTAVAVGEANFRTDANPTANPTVQLTKVAIKTSPFAKSELPVWGIYTSVALLLGLVFWQLHEIFVNLPAVGIRALT